MSYLEPNFYVVRPDHSEETILNAEALKFKNCRVSEIEFLLVHPTAEVLEFIDCEWDTVATVPVSDHGAAHTIRLVETMISDLGFREILTKFPELRTLAYFRPTEDIDTDLDEMGTELARYGQHIEHLTLLNESLLPFASGFGSLHKMINLKTLEVDLELLIGFRDNPRGWDDYEGCGYYGNEESEESEEEPEPDIHWSLVNRLPPSLEKLTLSIETPKLSVYFNTYESYGAKFEELLTDARFAKLRWVHAPNLDTVAEKLKGKPGNEWGLLGTGESILARPPTRPEAEAEAEAEAEEKKHVNGSSASDSETLA
ncbi:hypothetical protein F4803DRAFT_39504 [Xylaria telfairii]|nr:hypothetical protein F4803DRAFT_39504 [Xylaria telfairii]